MQIHIARKGALLGVFTAEEVLAGLAAGRFVATDLAWREGMAEWKGLGEWPEFASATVTPSAAAPTMPVAASTVPWELGKSPGAFFATVREAILNPAGLASGRFGFGDWLAFCYVAVACALPFQVAGLLMVGNQNAAMAALIRKLDLPQFNAIADQMSSAPPTSAGLMILSLVMNMAFAPILYAGFGLAHWAGQRVFRIKVPAERTVSATLLAFGTIILLAAPVQLLAVELLVQLVVSALLFIPFCVVHYRALGAATGVNPWAQFGISCFVWLVLCACCCLGPILLLTGAMGAIAQR